VAQRHVAFPFENCIWVWGGDGKNGSNLPGNVFWILNPATLSWTQVKTKGEIPEGRSLACGAIIGHKFYLFGGYGEKDGILFVCNLKTLTWRRTEPKGKTPVGRFRATAWTHGGKFYVFGGRNSSGKPSGKFLQGGDWKDDVTNQLSVYSIKTNKWKDITSRGPTPQPRWGMGQARISDTVYIVGGVGA
jgi:N-acetylneuraminic acid mutarotase